jgi:hypothetical protein
VGCDEAFEVFVDKCCLCMISQLLCG